MAQRLFPYASAEDVFNEHRETTRGRDLNITGLSYALLDQSGYGFGEGREISTHRPAQLGRIYHGADRQDNARRISGAGQ